MNERLFSPRPDRPWPIVALAGASWAPIWTFLDGHPSAALVAGWLLLLALTVLPLCLADPLVFRRTCLVLGGIMVGFQAVVTAPYLLIPLPFFVAFLPAGALLLLAGWKRDDGARTGLAAILVGVPFAIAVWRLCHSY